tara:strand:+ start:4975 stop:5568 length:594 start_codon:yes stop_codon:yes gene_type:complete
MSLSEELKQQIVKYKNKEYTIRGKKEVYDLKEILKYSIYCKSIIDNYRSKVGMTGISFVPPEENKMEIGYGQLEQVSFGMGLDPKMPLDSFILSTIEFLDSNNFNDKDLETVKKFIDDYNIFMEPIEYKSPVYLSIGYLCVINSQTIITKPVVDIVDEFGDGGSEFGDGGSEFGDGGSDYEDGGSDYGDEFGEDEEW